MEPESFLPFPQDSATGFYPEQNEHSPRLHVLFLKDKF
jgi:hypothetical protein